MLLFRSKKQTSKDVADTTFKELDIAYNNWEESALYRPEWRKAVRDGCSLLEANRYGRAKLKRTYKTTCATCNKACKSISSLKRHMIIHNDLLLQPDPINPVKTAFVCHLCYRPCKVAACLRSHLRARGREKDPMDEN